MTQKEIIEMIENTIKNAGGDNANCVIQPTSNANIFLFALYCCGDIQLFNVYTSNCPTITLTQAISDILAAYNKRVHYDGDGKHFSDEYKETINKISEAMCNQVKI